MLKLYVLIRDDLSEAQQAVQAGHALSQFGLEHRAAFEAWQKDNNTLIYLSIKNIPYWKTVLEDGGLKYSVFHEPDVNEFMAYDGGMDTAIAVGPNWTCQYILFKDLPLAFQPKPKPAPQTVNVFREAPAPEPKKKWWQ